jgi:glyoxylase-like metal-dependent hydrolase (beta-lactamase superfamily II)
LLRTISDKPVRHLINTHWHGDHTLGNARWAEVFPGLEIIGHVKTREAMSGPAMNYVQEYIRDLPAFAEQLDKSVQTGKRSDGTSLTPEQIERNRRFAGDVRAYVTALVASKIMPPTRTITDKLTLELDGKKIELIFPGEGHTDGDLVVWLPEQKILIGGDLVGSPIPFGTASYPKHWAADLDQIVALKPRLIAPGHGPVQRDLTYVRQLHDLLARIAGQAEKAAAEKVTFEAFERSLDLGTTAAPFKGDDNQDYMFRETFLKPITRSAYDEATGKAIVQGALGKS